MNNWQQWNESQWKNEIRQHEEEVASFFQDLVYCLDLPMDELPPELPDPVETPSDAVAAGKNAALRQWIRDHEEEDPEEEQDLDYEPRHPVCFSCVDSLDQLAVAWNTFSAGFASREERRFALGISCAFAKLLARTADFTEPAKFCSPQLLTTLGKMAIADLEDLVSRLDQCREMVNADDGQFSYFRSRLALVREQLIEKLKELRD